MMKKVIFSRSIKTLFVAAAILSITSAASAQVFRRVANEPFSGRVAISNRLKNQPTTQPTDRFRPVAPVTLSADSLSTVETPENKVAAI